MMIHDDAFENHHLGQFRLSSEHSATRPIVSTDIEETSTTRSTRVSPVMDSVNIKERLNAYRRQKRREEMTESIKTTMQNILLWSGNRMTDDQLLVASTKDEEDVQDTESTCSDDSEHRPSQCTVLKAVTYLLYFLLWTTLYIIAIEFEFGAIYFIASTFTFIWLNTRTRPKKPGELSAYSVFNPNCKSIEGTLNSSQMEKEVLHSIAGIYIP